jgi:membrane protease YdiL (CAAX protease family)
VRPSLNSEQRSLTRADWIVIVVALLLPTAITWVYFILLNGAEKQLQQGAYAVGKTVQFALPVVWVWLVQRERQWPRLPSMWSVAVGIAFGLVVAAGMQAIYSAVPQVFDAPGAEVRKKVESFGISSPAAYVLFAVFVSAIHSLLEEYYWRWFVFGQLVRGCTLPIAIVISSVAFAAHHVLVLGLYFGYSGPTWLLTWLFSLAVAIGGAFWAWLYRASDSLAASWLSHVCIDAAIFVIGYKMIMN